LISDATFPFRLSAVWRANRAAARRQPAARPASGFRADRSFGIRRRAVRSDSLQFFGCVFRKRQSVCARQLERSAGDGFQQSVRGGHIGDSRRPVPLVPVRRARDRLLFVFIPRLSVFQIGHRRAVHRRYAGRPLRFLRSRQPVRPGYADENDRAVRRQPRAYVYGCRTQSERDPRQQLLDVRRRDDVDPDAGAGAAAADDVAFEAVVAAGRDRLDADFLCDVGRDGGYECAGRLRQRQ